MGRAWVCEKIKAKTDEMVRCIVFGKGESLKLKSISAPVCSSNIGKLSPKCPWVAACGPYLWSSLPSRLATAVPLENCSTLGYTIVTHVEPIEVLSWILDP